MALIQSVFPFSAIVGQDELKLALLLNVIDPSLGGVLAVGDKGTGKTTLIRSLTSLMNTHELFPFVNLPIGASEDRVLGHINLETLINKKQEQVTPGLLAKAHQGFLYVDEINLLNDYLMDVLLDAASAGTYHLEREGISKKLDSRFCLIGSMNPEEGDLRPQLKDRFGLSVHTTTPTAIELRTQIIQNRIEFDDNPIQFSNRFKKEEEQLYLNIKKAQEQVKHIKFNPELYTECAIIASEHAVEGMRADILLLKTVRAYTAFLGETEITSKHLKTITPLVLNHRSNQKTPQNQPNSIQEQPENENIKEEQNNEQSLPEHTFKPIIPSNELDIKTRVQTITKKGVEAVLRSSNHIELSKKKSTETKVDTKKTVSQYLATSDFELKYKKEQSKTTKHIIFLLDSSGSMQKDNMVAYAKGLIEKTIQKEAHTKLAFSLLSLYDGDVRVIVQYTMVINEIIEKLKELKTGGKTNGIAAFKKIKTIIATNTSLKNELIMITDGRFNAEGINDFEHTVIAYQTYCKKIKQLTIVDAEKGMVKLGLAKQFADKVNGKYELLEV